MVLVLLFLVLIGLKTTEAQPLGICYGRVANNLPLAKEVIDLYKSNGIGRMRIYDPDPTTLQALRGSNIELAVGVPNENIRSLASNVEAATNWVKTNILRYSQDVKFRYIVVGNEISPNDVTSQFVLPAMQNVYVALASANLQNQIRVSTAIQLELLDTSYPPSAGVFSPSSIAYITPIVKFLMNNGAPLLANVYPYFSYISDPTNIDLSYALFTSPKVVVKDEKYEYQNLFDASMGALYAALKKVGALDLKIVVSESGWPSQGGVAATIENAQTYYVNLMKHVQGGTPNRPNQPLETYLFAMFDENQKGPAETERHFGLFSPNKQPKYRIDQHNIHNSYDVPSSSSGVPSSSSHLASDGVIFYFCFFLLFLYYF